MHHCQWIWKLVDLVIFSREAERYYYFNEFSVDISVSCTYDKYWEIILQTAIYWSTRRTYVVLPVVFTWPLVWLLVAWLYVLKNRHFTKYARSITNCSKDELYRDTSKHSLPFLGRYLSSRDTSRYSLPFSPLFNWGKMR